jgi:flagellar L-ring protein precursor FlgH
MIASHCKPLLILGMTLLSMTVAPASRADDLYRSDGYRSLIADRRASHVGDIVTILVYENSTASSSADTSTNTSAGIQGNVTTMADTHHAPQLQVGDNYGGKGQIQREGRLLAQLSTTVTKVWPNGDLTVSGEQTINVNGEKTRIRLGGRVRPVDISQANTVQSNRLADAKIDYVGDGFITDRTHPGLLPRILAWLGLW